MTTPPATPPPTPPRALSSGYLSIRTDKVINSWKKPLFFAFVDSSIALDRLELVYKKGVKEAVESKVQAPEASAAEDVSAAPAEKSAFEAANERLFRTLATAAVSGSGILAAYRSTGEEDLKLPVMLINLRDITDVTLCPKHSKKNRHAFTIHTQGEKMVLATKVPEELEQWVKTIQRRYRITGDDDIEANAEYRSVYESLVAKKAFKKDVQVGDAVAEVTPEIEIVEAEASAAEGASAEVVEEAKQEIEVAAADESAATEETAAVAAEETKSESDAAVEEDAKPSDETATAEATDLAVAEEPAAAAIAIDVAPEEPAAAADAPVEGAPEELATAAEPQAAETAEPAKEAPSVAAKPKSTFMASITSLLKRKQADKVADNAVPQDIDDHVDESAAAVSTPTQADAEVPKIEVIAPVADEQAAEAAVADVEAAVGEPTGEPAASPEEEARAAASAPPSKKGILRFFARKPAAAKAADAEDTAPEEQQAVADADASEPVEDATPVVAEVPEEEAAKVEEITVAVEAGAPADPQPKEAKAAATGLLRSLSRMLKKRTPAPPVADAAESVAEVATDSAVETEAVAEVAPVSASETVVQAAVEIAAEESAGEEPAAAEPAAKEAAAEERAAEEPAAEMAAAEEEAAAEKPAAEKPAAEEEAAAEKPAAEEEAAAEKPAADEAVADAAGQSVSEPAKPAGRSLVRSFSKMVKKVVAK